MTNCLVSIPLVGLLAAVTAIVAVAGEPPDDNSPLGGVEPQELTVTAIKQTATADNQAAAATTITAREAEALNIVDARTASAKAPNFFIPDYGSRMTSTIYVRGLGARIDQPVVGLNVDNVPIMNKDNYDYPISWDTRELTLGSEFTSRNHGLALYHQSSCKLGRWNITAGVRVDYEHAALDYVSSCETGYDVIDASDGSLYKHFDVNLNESGHLSKSFWEVLPKVAVTYNASNNSRVYISAARGYKAGGFNTQMFSDVLQQRLMYSMGIGYEYDVDDVVTYKPEHSWTFEGGGTHLEWLSGALRLDATLFCILCTDQQLTMFPDGTTTGRVMTNAGKTRSYGVEIALNFKPTRNIEIGASYGHTNARFVEFNNGQEDFAKKIIPYAPQNTIFAQANYTIPVGCGWLQRIVIGASVKGAGRIYWNEANDEWQDLYALLGATVRLEWSGMSLDLWGENLPTPPTALSTSSR